MVSGLDNSRVVRTRVVRDLAQGIFEFGPVNDVPAEAGQECEVLMWGAVAWLLATVCWVDSGLDTAAVECSAVGGTGGVRWGRLEGSEPLEWTAMGFPVASVGAVSRQRPGRLLHGLGREPTMVALVAHPSDDPGCDRRTMQAPTCRLGPRSLTTNRQQVRRDALSAHREVTTTVHWRSACEESYLWA